MKAVIYARYSSAGQTEQSIEKVYKFLEELDKNARGEK